MSSKSIEPVQGDRDPDTIDWGVGTRSVVVWEPKESPGNARPWLARGLFEVETEHEDAADDLDWSGARTRLARGTREFEKPALDQSAEVTRATVQTTTVELPTRRAFGPAIVTMTLVGGGILVWSIGVAATLAVLCAAPIALAPLFLKAMGHTLTDPPHERPTRNAR